MAPNAAIMDSRIAKEVGQEIDALCTKHDLSDTVKMVAHRVYEQAAELEDVGRYADEQAAACVYAACREIGNSVNADELVADSDVEAKFVMRVYRRLSRKLGLKSKPLDPNQRVARIGEKVNAPKAVRKKAVAIINRADEAGAITGMNPSGVAASALYLVGREESRFTQAELADAGGVTEVTLRKRNKELSEFL